MIRILILFIARLRLPGPTHATTGNVFFDGLGKTVHSALYALVFLMAVSGGLPSLQSGLIPIVFGGSRDALPAEFSAFTARVVHGYLARALLALVVFHVCAVFYHQVLL